MTYPTKEEILAKDPKIAPGTEEIIISWKRSFLKDWKNTPKNIQLGRLQTLILAITIIAHNKIVVVKKGTTDCYCPREKTIYLNKNKPSILTALHETSHFLYGPSELTACRWSIYLFKTCFPSLFKSLKWKGHLLVK